MGNDENRYEEISAKAAKKGIVPGLERLRRLCEVLGEPQNSVPCVHIAGTNGKGSVLKMTAQCLIEAGYRVGCWFSPQVFEDEPCLTVSGCEVGENVLQKVGERIASACEKLENSGEETPTLFELETLRAIMCFGEEKCDICVVECGMGGRDDATNIIDSNIVCVMTPIGLDHMRFLGQTAEEIAENKAGIFREGCAVVSAPQQAGVAAVLRRCAEVKGCSLRVCGKPVIVDDRGFEGQAFEYGGERFDIRLCGAHQLENAAAAVEVMVALRERGFEISAEAVRAGLEKTRWHGRFELVCSDPPVVLDGAHNVPAAKVLREALDRYFAGKKIVLLFGILADKQYEKVAEIVASAAFRVVAFTPPVERALTGERLAEVCEKYAPSECCENVSQAVNRAIEIAESTENAAVCAAGSLYSLERVRREIIKMKGSKSAGDVNI